MRQEHAVNILADVLGGLAAKDHGRAAEAVFEFGHAVAMPHLNICGDLMYADAIGNVMSAYVPVLISYSGDDDASMGVSADGP